MTRQKTATDIISPVRLFVTVIIVIFVVEAIIMLLLPYSKGLNAFQTAILDATLLLIIMFPLLYVLLLKPLRRYLEEYRGLEKMVFAIEEREQKLIGQNLHDSLGQTLTGIAFQVKSLENRLKENLPITPDELSKITRLITDSTAQSKNLAKQLLSLGTEEESLVLALQKLALDTEDIYGIVCTFQGDEYFNLAHKEAVTHLYRIAQESVTNAVKHGEPEIIRILLERKGSRVTLTIKDNGRGMDTEKHSRNGLGLQILHHRATAINAEINIHSEVGEGTAVTCTFNDV